MELPNSSNAITPPLSPGEETFPEHPRWILTWPHPDRRRHVIASAALEARSEIKEYALWRAGKHGQFRANLFNSLAIDVKSGGRVALQGILRPNTSSGL